MREIIIRVEDDKVESIVKSIRNSGIEIESVDEIISFDEAKKGSRRLWKSIEAGE